MPANSFTHDFTHNLENESFVCVPKDVEFAEILLVYPDFAKNELGVNSYPENHLGLNRLASYLDFSGHTVKVLNTTGRTMSLSGPKELADFLRANKDSFGILGFHTNSWNVSDIVKILESDKDVFKDRLILFGGPLPTAAPQQLLDLFREIGYGNIGLVQGYGEHALEQIILHNDNLAEVAGVWSWQNGRLVKGSLQRLSDEQMAKLPFLSPKYNTFYQHFFRPYVEGAGARADAAGARETDAAGARADLGIDTLFCAQGLDTNHGCPFNCSYCSVHVFGHAINEYSAQRVCDELEYLAKETGFFMFTFTNSNLMFLRRGWIVDFCNEMISRGMHHYISWSGYHHPNTINLLSVEDLELINKSGCDQIVLGVQSIEPKILEIFNRQKNTYDVFKQIREKTAKAGLELVIDYIRGVPGEDLSMIWEFYDYCIRNKIEMREFLLKIYPNTEIMAKGLDFSAYEIIPITGNLARELDSFAVVPKMNNPKNLELTRKILVSNEQIKRNRKIRLGQFYLESGKQALELKDKIIPADPLIPAKVKTAMIRLLDSMLNPPAVTSPFMDLSPQQMMKTLIMADENSPPLVLKLQEKLRNELGEEKFQYFRKKYAEE